MKTKRKGFEGKGRNLVLVVTTLFTIAWLSRWAVPGLADFGYIAIALGIMSAGAFIVAVLTALQKPNEPKRFYTLMWLSLPGLVFTGVSYTWDIRGALFAVALWTMPSIIILYAAHGLLRGLLKGRRACHTNSAPIDG